MNTVEEIAYGQGNTISRDRSAMNTVVEIVQHEYSSQMHRSALKTVVEIVQH